MSSVNLNGDVFSHLLSFVSSPRDLLAASLTNRELFTLAGPELIYRSVRCRLGNNAVWEHLIANPALASRVRELEIQRENFSGYGPLDERERLPGEHLNLEGGSNSPTSEEIIARQSPSLEKTEKSERLLIKALHTLVNLERFTWDRWVPVINQGAEIPQILVESEEGRVPGSYQEDVWTALRDHTQIQKLKVVDLGRRETVAPDPRSIYESTIFSIRNLTHVDLKIYHSPANEDEGAGAGGNGDDDDDEGLLPGRVNIGPFQEFLLRCPNLEVLALTILDRGFYHGYGGNPFTDITPIVSAAHWPHLSSIRLSDIIIEDEAMAVFLSQHPSLREITAFLSLSDSDLPKLPFSLDGLELDKSFLPNLETIDLAPDLARPILRALSRPSSIQSISTIEPCEWDAAEDEPEEYVSSLDDTWGAPTGQDVDDENISQLADTWGVPVAEKCSEGETSKTNLLEGMSNLRSLRVKDLRSFAQLEKLVGATPNIESIYFTGRILDALREPRESHSELLPYISKWPRLTTFLGMTLLPGDVRLGEASSVIDEIVRACPNLREVSWVGGTATAVLVKDEGGSVKLVLQNGSA
ncbi:hypothetical protein BDZ94DRAFT_858896 [Collybia nuda]|uniref:F-box domain-containing protein n=1 Tax=Collybia nuda TaxID=64659 RepID=A0A9P5Y2G3_9AGAR|nr:hypothetical protein BDZ94DRAFT_858896 [Collybia nuda]